MKMNAILLLVTIIYTFLTPKKYRTFINPAIVFAMLWTFIVFLASIQWLDMYKASDDAYTIIVYGVLSFLAGSTLASFLKDVKVKKLNYLNNGEVVIRYNLLIALSIICILYYTPNFIKSLLLMLNGISINDVRSLIQESDYSRGLRNFIPNFIILPVSISLEVIAVIDFWLGKRNKKFIILTLMLVLIRILGDGGRTPLFNLLLYFIAAFSVLIKDRKDYLYNAFGWKEAKKAKKKFRRTVSLGVILLAILTFMRASLTVVRKLYFYFAMSPVLLSWWINEVDLERYRGNGVISLNGILYLFDYFIHNILQVPYTPVIIDAYNWVARTDSYWCKIAPTTTANAYVSCFWFFYADAGIVGVIVFAFLYGFVMSRYFYIVKKGNASICIVAIYLILFQGLFFSFIRFPFAKAYYIIALVFVRMIAFKRPVSA